MRLPRRFYRSRPTGGRGSAAATKRDILMTGGHGGAMAELILTNGDSAAELLREAGRQATILPWRDVLHEGPIAVDLAASTVGRVDYLARRFRIPAKEIAAGFAERDAIVCGHREFETVELWFEHDLFDQLQLLQILAFFAGEAARGGLVLVQADDFLGRQRADTILRFAEAARPVTRVDLDLAALVWAELAAPSPEAIPARAATANAPLPFLAPALRRFLEELPAPVSGLSRTEQVTLEAIRDGMTGPGDLFREALRQEEAAFMGDWSFFRILDDLASCDVPLIAGLAAPPAEGEDDMERFAGAVLELTMAGEDVIGGEEDHVVLSGIDRWWGGTRLLGRAVWRWDRTAMRLVSPGASGA
jgi:hypothetical protein